MIAVVIPAYNEESRVGEVVQSILQSGYHPVVVDDGSEDNTAAAATAAGAHVISHDENKGQGAALVTGVAYACQLRPSAIVTFDADGQHSVGDITKIVSPILHGGYDVALGSRYLGKAVGIGVMRRTLLHFAVLFTKLVSGYRVTDSHNGLRAMSLPAARRFKLSCHRMGHASEVFDWLRDHKLRFVEVGVTITYTSDSLANGQKNLDSIRVLWEYGTYKFRRIRYSRLSANPAELGKPLKSPSIL